MMPRTSHAEEIRELLQEERDAPRCAVCGGPDAEGNGCEFCPAVGTGAVESATHDV